ncbi:unnamed protein product, partial [Didymodactylos carnosus]
MRTRFGALER